MNEHPHGNMSKLYHDKRAPYNPNHARILTEAGVYDISEGPLDIRIGDTYLQVVNPKRDQITTPDGHGGFNPAIDYYLIDPNALNFDEDRGYKALRDEEEVTLGRNPDLQGRFNLQEDDKISRRHMTLTRVADKLIVLDLESTNGTYVGHVALGSLGINKPSVDTTANRQVDGERLRVSLEAASVASERHPERNEDHYFTNETAAGVFDGVGGSAGSEVASQLAAQHIDKFLSGTPKVLPFAQAEAMIKSALTTAGRAINEFARGSRISTTATIAKILENEHGEPYAVIASAGDSRAYLLRNNSLQAVTLDESITVASAGTPEEGRARQEKFANVADESDLSESELHAFRRQNMIFGALGGGQEKVDIQAHIVPLEKGDKILLTSDGIHDNLTSREIEAILRNSLVNSCNALVEAARERSRQKHIRAKPDDMTAATISYDGK